MKLLLLFTLLAAGATAFRISSKSRWKSDSVFQYNIPSIYPMVEYNLFGHYCDYATRENRVADLDWCCQIRDICYDLVKKLENCKSLIDDPKITLYTYSCSGNEVTCRGRNNTCENLICNCDRQAAICFSQAPNNKGNKGIYC